MSQGFTNDITIPIPFSQGGTGAGLIASNGGILYSTATEAAILPGTPTAGLALLSGSSSAPTWSASPPLLTAGGTMIGNIAFSPSTAGITGTPTNDNATAGTVGEFVSSSIAIGSAVALTTATAANITSISLTAGDWDVWGVMVTNPALGTTTPQAACGINTVSATYPTLGIATPNTNINGIPSNPNQSITLTVPTGRLSLSATTTIYLVGLVTFSVSTMSAFGYIAARRVR